MLKEYFDFSRGEKRSILLLLLLILLTIAAQWIYPFFIKKQVADFSHLEAELLAFENSLTVKPDRFDPPQLVKKAAENYDYFEFDPNTINHEQWKQLGISQKQSRVIAKYLKTGASFRAKEDLKKIYVISDEDYTRLAPFIVIPESDEKVADPPMENKLINDSLFLFNPNDITNHELMCLGFSKKNVATYRKYLSAGGQFVHREDLSKLYGLSDSVYDKIYNFIDLPVKTAEENKERNTTFTYKIYELNSCTAVELEDLNGIGPVLSKRIVEFREKAGGFYAIKQLRDIYGLRTETYEMIQERLSADASMVHTIDLNFASRDELIAHPYLNSGQARAIVKFRNRHGNFSSVDQMGQIEMLSDSVLRKIKPYFRVNK
jgi:DNA uptake protein ComE-like DNA-binding protein